MADVTAEELAAAEADFVSTKGRRNVSAEDKRAAAEALSDLRTRFRAQEEAAGRRAGLVTTED